MLVSALDVRVYELAGTATAQAHPNPNPSPNPNPNPNPNPTRAPSQVRYRRACCTGRPG